MSKYWGTSVVKFLLQNLASGRRCSCCVGWAARPAQTQVFQNTVPRATPLCLLCPPRSLPRVSLPPRHQPAPPGRGGCAGLPQTSTVPVIGRQSWSLKKKINKIRCFHRCGLRSDPPAFLSWAGYLIISRIILIHHPSEGGASEWVSVSMTSISR